MGITDSLTINLKTIIKLRSFNHIASLLLLALTVSCVGEDYGDCEPFVPPPDPWKHIVSVVDKNYSNGARFGDPIVVVDEALPFSTWVSSLTLWRHNAALSDYRVDNATVAPTDQVHPLSVESWPAGVNRVTAIGNEAVLSQTFSQTSATLALHPEGREYNDIYIGMADVPMPPTADVDVKLRRTKGLLVVFVENIPETADSLYVSVNNLYAAVDGAMNYSGAGSVTKGFKAGGANMTLTTQLAPTVDAGNSTVALTVTDADGSRDKRDITTVTMKRNEVSGIRTRITPTENEDSVVWVYVDGEWNRVTPLHVTR